ncbi:hypothetical protein [Nonomuraea sp. KM88]|uniref:hypothetical protein n=1 Tax=Nonomuraea sp. KM88 TaxID=3457427 RepID=UPI003FCC4590
MATHLIHGRTVGMPVRVRDAEICGAFHPVRADAARAVIAYSGLDVAEVLPGKALCVLLFVDYRDGDLDAYHEFGMAFLVRPPPCRWGTHITPKSCFLDLRTKCGDVVTMGA